MTFTLLFRFGIIQKNYIFYKEIIMDNKVLIIIPAYNEEKSIAQVYQNICDYNEKNSTNYDVIVINDGSVDNTKEICERKNIPVINLVHNLGIGGAVQTGYKYARDNNYMYAVQFDGDGQHEVSCIKDILQPIYDNEADFVIGSRFIDKNSSEFKSSFARRVGIRIISNLIKIMTGKRLHDITSGFRAANRKIILDFAISYPVEYPEPITNTELLKKNVRIKEVPVQMHEREAGISSINSWKNVYFMINIIISVFIVGIRRWKK